MKRILLILFLFPLLVSATPYKYDGSGYCQDFTSSLSRFEIISMNEKLKTISSQSSVEIATVMIPSLNDRDIEGFANELFREWGIGKSSSNNGVLVLLSLKDRKSRIEVGYGMEPYLTDAESRRILDDMKPYLRNGDYYGAFSFAIEKIQNTIAEAKADKSSYASSPAKSPYVDKKEQVPSEPIDWGSVLLYFISLILLASGVILVIFLVRKTREFSKAVDEKIDIVKDYSSRTSDLCNQVEMKDESESVLDKGGFLIRKLKSLRYNIFSDSERDNTFSYVDDELDKMREFYLKADTEKRRRERLKREEEIRLEKIRKEEEERKKRIRDEADVIRKSKKLLSENSGDKLNSDFDLAKETFSNMFPGVKFIDKPAYVKGIENLQQAVSLSKGDGNALSVIKSKMEDLLMMMSASQDRTEEVKRTKSSLKKGLEDLNKKKSLLTKAVISTKLREDISLSINNESKLAEESYLKNDLDACQSHLNRSSQSLDKLNQLISDEEYLKKYIKEVEKNLNSYGSGKYVSGNSTRRRWSEEAKQLLDKAKASIDPDSSKESMKYSKESAELISKITRHFKEEEEAEERKRREEEDRRRRKREEEEEEDRRRRNSYSSSYSSWDSSSSSSSSWDSGSSFGGGDSGGGGASSGW